MLKTNELLKAALDLAKDGNKDAIKALRDAFSLKVFTHKEIERVNALRLECGLSINEAIKQARKEIKDEISGGTFKGEAGVSKDRMDKM